MRSLNVAIKEIKCNKCGKVKSIEEFSKKNDGEYNKSCDKCREIQKKHYEQNKYVIREKQKKYNEENKDVISEYGKKYYEQNKDVLNEKQNQYREQNKDVISKYQKQYREENKDVISERNKKYLVSLSLHDSWFDKLNTYEECRQDSNDITLLQVKCTKCGEWFNPITGMVISRLQSINGTGTGECRFYCSQECKDSCEIYKQISWPKGLNPYSKREGSSKLRKHVLERDEHTCQKCYSTEDLECHHIVPVKIDKSLMNNPDNCITLCHTCHMEAHSDYDCTTRYLANI